MLVLRYLVQQINKALTLRDPRLQGLPFTSIHSFIAVVALYLLFVLKYGPRFMTSRKPYKIERLLLFYNVFQVLVNFSFAFYGIYSINSHKGYVNFLCHEFDFSDSIPATIAVFMTYYYYLIKLLDLFDTIFIVLRKRTRQISFLHVYHHVGIFLGAFISISWFPAGHMWFFAGLNCVVHVIMYGYYFASIYSIKLKTNLTIKRSITQLQIIQFFLSIIHMSLPFFVNDCDYPKILLILMISQHALMIMLFSNFYYHNYIKAPKLKSN